MHGVTVKLRELLRASVLAAMLDPALQNPAETLHYLKMRQKLCHQPLGTPSRIPRRRQAVDHKAFTASATGLLSAGK